MKLQSLILTETTHQEVHKFLFPGDGLEAAGILLCNQGSGKLTQRLMVSDFISLSHTRSERKEKFLSWPFEQHLTTEKITNIDQNKQSILTIHSHPNGYNKFSKLDDHNDKLLFKSVNAWFDDERINGSAIMLPDGTILARSINHEGKFHNFDTVSVVGDTIKFWKKPIQQTKTSYENKLSQTFGNKTLDTLRSLRVGVIGCSGTGSIIIELLTRNCVGHLVLVDDDVLEEKNLNRIVNSKLSDAKKGISKVKAIKKEIQNIQLGTVVHDYQAQSNSPEAIEALIDCDVVFGCVDSASGRFHLDCLSSAYLIPYFDVGVHIDADGVGGINTADAVANYIQPDGSDLLSRGVYTMDQVSAEHWKTIDRKHYENQKIAGYLANVGEEQPAVISLNMQASCMAFNDFLARLHSYRLDRDREYSTQRFRLVHGSYENETDQRVSNGVFSRYKGTGDRSLLVRNIKLAEAPI